MSSDIIQADYEALATIARRFAEHGEATAELRQRLAQRAEALSGSWRGQGGHAFQEEMTGELLPALQRLAESLGEAARTTEQIGATFRQAEMEAQALFKSTGATEAPKAPAEEDGGGGGLWGSIGEWVHGGLDVLGLVPGFGEVADGVNGLIYLAEGRNLEAGLSFGAMIPFLGWGATAGKVGLRIGREAIEEGVERGVREGVEEGGERLARDLADPPPSITVASGHKSVQDPTFLRYGDLPPSSTFTRNGYEYVTDADGRVVQASGQLRLDDFPRYRDYETQVGHAGLPGDQGGHLIGNRFGGTSEGVNLVPQNGNLNVSAWKRMENEWATAVGRGDNVAVNIQNVYPPGGTRPDRFVVRYTINGQPYTRIFRNQPGG